MQRVIVYDDRADAGIFVSADMSTLEGLAETCAWVLFACKQTYDQWHRLSSVMDSGLFMHRMNLLQRLAPARRTIFWKSVSNDAGSRGNDREQRGRKRVRVSFRLRVF